MWNMLESTDLLFSVYLEMVEILGQVVGPGGLLGQEGVEVGGQLVLCHHHLLAHCLQLILHRKKKVLEFPAPVRDVTIPNSPRAVLMTS